MFRIFTFITLFFFSSSGFALEESALKSKLPEDKVLGKSSAKVTIIEYASLSCHHCAEFHTNVLPTIQKEYIDTGKVQLIFRDFPLNESALTAAQLAHCAAKQDGDEKYFALLKALFEKQKDWAFGKDFKPKLLEIAKGLGLKPEPLETCLANKEIETKILNSRMDGGKKLGVESTPTIFINGDKADSMRSVEDARKALDTVLGGKSLSQAAKEAAKEILVISSDENVIGDKKAKVSIIEYANISCHHCGQFHKTLMGILQKDYIESGKVRFAFRELPMNPTTFYAYMVAHCKGDDEFFNILSLLIDETPNWAGTSAFINPLIKVAEKAGIKKKAFYSCIEDKDIETRLLKTSQNAVKIGIKHSPELYINGEKAEGLNSPEAIRQAVEDALANSKN